MINYYTIVMGRTINNDGYVRFCKDKEDTLQSNKYFAKLSKISDDRLKELGMVHENGINEGFEFKGKGDV